MEIGEKLGLIFHPDKFAEGSEIEMLGVSLNLTDKTAKVNETNIKKLSDLAKTAIFRGKMSEKDLEKLMGCIAFAAQFCEAGRLNTFYLTAELARVQRRSRELSHSLEISLEGDLLRELGYWAEFSSAESLSFKKRPEFASSFECFSDASDHLWAVKFGARSFSGRFPEELKESDIMTKEAFALKQAIDKLEIKGFEITIFCDNQPLTYAYKHQYSRNPKVHQILKETYDISLARDNAVKVQWVPTSRMAEVGADPESRGIYQPDQSALSEEGVKRAKEFMNLTPTERLLDLFSAPSDNVFNCYYFSLQVREEDPLNMEEDAWSLLDRLKSENRKIRDVFWVFPPREMAIKAASDIALVGLGSEAKVFFLLDADLAAQVVLKFRDGLDLEVANFSTGRSKRLFRKRSSKPKTLLKIVASSV